MGRKELMAFRADCGVHLDENGRIVMWENQAMSDVIKAEDITPSVRKKIVNALSCSQRGFESEAAAMPRDQVRRWLCGG